MFLTFALMAVACLLTHKVVPESWLLFPGLAAASCLFLPDPVAQLLTFSAGIVFWLLKLRQEARI